MQICEPCGGTGYVSNESGYIEDPPTWCGACQGAGEVLTDAEIDEQADGFSYWGTETPVSQVDQYAEAARIRAVLTRKAS